MLKWMSSMLFLLSFVAMVGMYAARNTLLMPVLAGLMLVLIMAAIAALHVDSEDMDEVHE